MNYGNVVVGGGVLIVLIIIFVLFAGRAETSLTNKYAQDAIDKYVMKPLVKYDTTKMNGSIKKVLTAIDFRLESWKNILYSKSSSPIDYFYVISVLLITCAVIFLALSKDKNKTQYILPILLTLVTVLVVMRILVAKLDPIVPSRLVRVVYDTLSKNL